MKEVWALTIADGLMLAACAAFILGLKQMGRKQSAKRGNLVSSLGMMAAVAGALLQAQADLLLVVSIVGVGTVVGFALALRVKMTSMPELVAVFNGLGGLASLCVGLIGLLPGSDPSSTAQALSAASVIIGGIAFSGSLVAYAKLAGHIGVAAVTFPLQLTFNFATLVVAVAAGAWATLGDAVALHAIVLVAASLILGVLGVVRIGGGDMPVVVALLNSYSGIAAALAGTAIESPALMVAGTLVGASGFMLTRVMCKAMNRSLSNVLFGGFGAKSAPSGSNEPTGSVTPISAEDAFLVLEAARSVVFVPGYGMAVAKAQHAVHELSQLLMANGCDVQFVIHPVAGRMPGHMNVLLAEAGVDYDLLRELGDFNESIRLMDVAVVIGANDVVNPDAREDPASPLYGMPIVNVDRAKCTIVLKRSMASGFAGVGNTLFTKPKTRMLFGDARSSVTKINEQFVA
jgi:NAD(P) transhydrogenase subunit beta